jgi:dTDP-4-dehydrorhamnose reductase
MKLERGTRAELPENETHSFLSMDIALKAIEWVITQESKNATYNLGGLTKISLFEYGKLIAETLNFNPNLITPGQAQFQTDVDFSLNGSEIVTQLDIDPLTLEQGLNLLKKQLVCGLTSHTA